MYRKSFDDLSHRRDFSIATHGQLNQLAITPKGLAWGLVSSCLYALYIILPYSANSKMVVLVTGNGMLYFRLGDDSLSQEEDFFMANIAWII